MKTTFTKSEITEYLNKEVNLIYGDTIIVNTSLPTESVEEILKYADPDYMFELGKAIGQMEGKITTINKMMKFFKIGNNI